MSIALPTLLRGFAGHRGPARTLCRCKSLLVILSVTALLPGCSIRKMAVNKLGNALAASGSTFASDNDPQLVRDAAPFSLKLMESLLAESPRHQGLLLAAARGFTQYSYAFVELDADRLVEEDLSAADERWNRARKLYLRARDYALRGLETRYPGFTAALKEDPKEAVQRTRVRDVPFLYWTAAAWGAAISVSKDDPDLIADQLIVEALIDRALELDEDWEKGAIHMFLIAYEMARQGARGDPAARARRHFERALDLSGGQAASPLVAFAETVAVQQQDRALFEKLLQQALAIDPEARPEATLSNVIMQDRARWLLSRIDELFLPLPNEEQK